MPALWQVSIANSISFSSEIPVDNIIGLFLEATYSISGISVISKDAILYAGTLNFSKKSTEDWSNGEEKQIKPSFFAHSVKN